MADLTSEEQLRLLEAALVKGGGLPLGLQLTPPDPQENTIRDPYGTLTHWGPKESNPTGFRPMSSEYDPTTRSFTETPWTPPPPKPAPVVEPVPIPTPKVGGGGGGDNKTDTPSGVSAYKTKDGKVFFTNQQAPEGTTPLSYEKGYEEAKLPGAPGRGGFVFAQEPPEVQQLKKLRDTLLMQQISEASMTPEDKLKLLINQQKQLGAAQTQNKLDEMKKLSDMLMGTKMTDKDFGWEETKQEFYKQLVKDQSVPGFKGPKLTDQQLWEKAYQLTQAAAERKHARNMLQLHMIDSRAQMLPGVNMGE